MVRIVERRGRVCIIINIIPGNPAKCNSLYVIKVYAQNHYILFLGHFWTLFIPLDILLWAPFAFLNNMLMKVDILHNGIKQSFVYMLMDIHIKWAYNKIIERR